MRRISSVLFMVTILSLALAACAPAMVTETSSTSVETLTIADTPAASEPVQPTEDTQPVTSVDPFDINPADFSGDLTMAGSSTVYPVSEKMIELFKAEGFEGMGNIKLDSIGSGAGFERFCKTGETDIANASRGIKDSEIEACATLNRTPIEFRVGTDALAIVVNTDNAFVSNVSIDELAKIFSSDAQKWSDVNPEWPAEDIHRYAPGTDSGTYDFFIETVMDPAYGDAGEEKFLNAANLQASEDDNVLVQGVSGDPYAIGFFGFAYYHENESVLNILSVNDVAPSFETAESGDYPLSRPLFIYSDAGIMQEKPQVAAFIGFYLANVTGLISEVGYFPASEEALEAAKEAYLAALQ